MALPQGAGSMFPADKERSAVWRQGAARKPAQYLQIPPEAWLMPAVSCQIAGLSKTCRLDLHEHPPRGAKDMQLPATGGRRDAKRTVEASELLHVLS